MKRILSNYNPSDITEYVLSNKTKNQLPATLENLLTIDVKQPILEQLTGHSIKTLHFDTRDLVLFPLYMTCKQFKKTVLEYVELPEIIWIWFIRSDFISSHVFFHYHDSRYFAWIEDIGLNVVWYRTQKSLIQYDSGWSNGKYLFDNPKKLKPNPYTTINYLLFIRETLDFDNILEMIILFATERREHELLSLINDEFGPRVAGQFALAAGRRISTIINQVLELSYDGNELVKAIRSLASYEPSFARIYLLACIREKQIEKVLDLLNKHQYDLCFSEYVLEAIKTGNLYLVKILTKKYFEKHGTDRTIDRWPSITLALEHNCSLELIRYICKKYPIHDRSWVPHTLMKYIAKHNRQDILRLLVEVDVHGTKMIYSKKLLRLCYKYHQISLARQITTILINNGKDIQYIRADRSLGSKREQAFKIKRICVTDDDILWLVGPNGVDALSRKCITNLWCYMLLNSKLEFIKSVLKPNTEESVDTYVQICLIINKRRDVLLWFKESDMTLGYYLACLERALQYRAYDMALFLHEECIFNYDKTLRDTSEIIHSESSPVLYEKTRFGISIGNDIMAYLWLLEHGYVTKFNVFLLIIMDPALGAFIGRHQISTFSDCFPMRWVSQ